MVALTSPLRVYLGFFLLQVVKCSHNHCIPGNLCKPEIGTTTCLGTEMYTNVAVRCVTDAPSGAYHHPRCRDGPGQMVTVGRYESDSSVLECTLSDIATCTYNPSSASSASMSEKSAAPTPTMMTLMGK